MIMYYRPSRRELNLPAVELKLGSTVWLRDRNDSRRKQWSKHKIIRENKQNWIIEFGQIYRVNKKTHELSRIEFGYNDIAFCEDEVMIVDYMGDNWITILDLVRCQQDAKTISAIASLSGFTPPPPLQIRNPVITRSDGMKLRLVNAVMLDSLNFDAPDLRARLLEGI